MWLRIRLPLYVSLAAAFGSLARGYFEGGEAAAGRWLIGFGALWAFVQWKERRWRWFPPAGLFAALAAAAYGLWIGLPPAWMLAGAVGALFAWDLAEFERLLREAAPADAPALARRRLIRLALLAALCLVWSLLGTLWARRFALEWLAYAAILAALFVSLRQGQRQVR